MKRRILTWGGWGVTCAAGLIAAASGSARAQGCAAWEHLPAPVVGDDSNLFFGVSGSSGSDVWAVGFWSPIPPPFEGSSLYTLIEHFDGEGWTVIPSPNPDPDTTTPYNQLEGVVALTPSDAVAVGIYSPVGAIAQAMAMRWDGSAWSMMDTPSTSGGSALNAVTRSPSGSVWAAGLVNPNVPVPGALSTGLLARRQGNGWQMLPAPRVGARTNSFRGVSAVRDDAVWCVGNHGDTPGDFDVLIQRFDGSGWTTFAVPTPGQFDSLEDVVALGDDDVWAVGYWLPAGQRTQPLIMHFDGSAWTRAALPTYTQGPCELRSVAARGPADVVAVGTHADADGVPRPFMLRYDGIAWSEAPTLTTDGMGEWFRGVTATGDGSMFAVGQYATSVSAPLTARLGGSCCQPDLTGDGNVDQDDVACLVAMLAGDPGCSGENPDFNRDGNTDQGDVSALIDVIAGGSCP